MCVVSAVMDQYRPWFPERPYRGPYEKPPKNPPLTPRPIKLDPDQLRELIESFREAVSAAEKFDELTGEPDCIDPEKAKLLERVDRLEEELQGVRDELSP